MPSPALLAIFQTMPSQKHSLKCECYVCTHKFTKGNVSIPLEWVEELDGWGLDPDNAGIVCPICGSNSIGYGETGNTECYA